MSAARKFALIAVLAVATATLSVPSLYAQGAAPNPGGGTSARPAIEEGATSVALGDFLSAGFGLRGWVLTQLLSRQFAPAASQSALARNLAVVAARRNWAR